MRPLPVILGLLLQGPRYGYELKGLIDSECQPFWRTDLPQLYRALAKAAASGAVHVRAEPSSKGPDRKRYSITAHGEEIFETWLREPPGKLEELAIKLRLAMLNDRLDASLLDIYHAHSTSVRAKNMAAYLDALRVGGPHRRTIAETELRRAESALAALSQYRPDYSPSDIPGPCTIVGSDDPLLTRLAGAANVRLRVTGSYGGLWALARGETEVAAVHLLDPDSDEYNTPYIRRLLPEQDVLLINLAWRDSGLMVAPGNPRGIQTLRDLLRPDVRFVNRQSAAGTRLMLFWKLRAEGIDARAIPGWNTALATHDAVADAIHERVADVGPGARATAARAGLDFIPLVRERYDLAVNRRFHDSAAAAPLLEALHGQSLHGSAAGLLGYDLSAAGHVVAHVH